MEFFEFLNVGVAVAIGVDAGGEVDAGRGLGTLALVPGSKVLDSVCAEWAGKLVEVKSESRTFGPLPISTPRTLVAPRAFTRQFLRVEVPPLSP